MDFLELFEGVVVVVSSVVSCFLVELVVESLVGGY